MASNLLAMASKPRSDGLQPSSDVLLSCVIFLYWKLKRLLLLLEPHHRFAFGVGLNKIDPTKAQAQAAQGVGKVAKLQQCSMLRVQAAADAMQLGLFTSKQQE